MDLPLVRRVLSRGRSVCGLCFLDEWRIGASIARFNAKPRATDDLTDGVASDSGSFRFGYGAYELQRGYRGLGERVVTDADDA